MIETAQDLISIAINRMGKNEDDSVRTLLAAAQIVLQIERVTQIRQNAQNAAAANRA